ncbi:MAG: flagellar biosynthesis protein FlhF [Thermogutta sp.]
MDAMDVRTFRASTMHEALAIVRKELGPDAAILRTREVRVRRWFGLLPGRPQIEITASTNVNVPSRLPPQPFLGNGLNRDPIVEAGLSLERSAAETRALVMRTGAFHPEVQHRLENMEHMLRTLCRRNGTSVPYDWPEHLFKVYTDLIDADLREEDARELLERVRAEATRDRADEPMLIKARLARILESELAATQPIRIFPGRCRVCALVGPTGVGKTTTIAKLAANFRLRENRRVALITVDTYRIAAVEQLRTYADIIDLPMHVVSTPREMRDAVKDFTGFDLVLIDTAGRSPKDEIKIRELRTLLNEAHADEIHLVLSSVASAKTLLQTLEQFRTVGPTALVLTKLDEAPSFGGLLPILRSSGLPVSYLTNGQNVPDDIEVAQPSRLARLVLGMDKVHRDGP